MNIDLKTIDPAYDLMPQFAKLTNGAVPSLQTIRAKTIFMDGAISAKHKVLAALLWSICARCEPCVRFYAQEASKRGASEEEVAEICGVAIAMGGCVGETWALKAFHAFQGQGTDESNDCCCGS